MDSLAAALEFTKALAAEAAEMARSRAAGVTPKEKANATYVTDLDHDMEGFLRSRIANRFPDDQLTGEELAASGGNGPRKWSIDPIDGTGNLVHGLPLWSISIGLIDNGEPVLGVIAVPPLWELFWAVKGGGAWKDGQPITANDSHTFHQQDNIGLNTNVLRIIDMRSLPGRVRDIGSTCCVHAFTAMGRLTCSAFLGGQTHDLAAGAVITSEAGCRFGTIDGRLLTPSEYVAETPVAVPTFVAPPHRLATLMATVKRL